MSTNINPVPDGARFLDVNPAEPEPAERRRRRSRTSSCGPYLGYQDITIRSHFGNVALQLAAGAAESPLHQRPAVRGRLHAGQDVSSGRTRIRRPSIPLRPGDAWNVAPDESTQLHNLVVNYTWDVPDGSRMWNNLLTRGLLDGWQLSGDTAVVSGDWAGASISTTDNFDFTGGDGGTSAEDQRRRALHERQLRSDAWRRAAATSTSSAFSRLTGRGDIGNAPRTLLPAAEDREHEHLARSRTSRIGGGRRMQFRWEMYNVFNQVNWSAINTDRAVQPGGRTGQRQLRQGDGGARPAHHAGGDSVHF